MDSPKHIDVGEAVEHDHDGVSYEAPAVHELGGSVDFFLGDIGQIMDNPKTFAASSARCW